VSARPSIGLCAAVEDARWGVWTERAALLPYSYARSVQRAGGIAMMLPPDPELTAHPDELLDRLDGLVLTGGCDIDPGSYGAERHAARAAMERDLPLLGICRGMQLLNIACGGGIDQHLPDALGTERHRHTPGVFADHHVKLAPGSLAERTVGRDREPVKSHHHQGVDGLGGGLVATGWSDEDGVIEAIELPERRFALGVLWHPEEDEASRVLRVLVDEARTRASSREAAPR
jgi:putative glutamine amidotransferase